MADVAMENPVDHPVRPKDDAAKAPAVAPTSESVAIPWTHVTDDFVSTWHVAKPKEYKSGGQGAFVKLSPTSREAPYVKLPPLYASHPCRLDGDYVDKTGVLKRLRPDNDSRWALSMSFREPAFRMMLEMLDNFAETTYESRKTEWIKQTNKQRKNITSIIRDKGETNPKTGEPYNPNVMVKGEWKQRKNGGLPFRFYGLFDETTGEIDTKSPAYIGTPGMDKIIEPDPLEFNEIQVFFRNGDRIVNKIPVYIDPASKTYLRCNNTGRVVLRYISPGEIPRGATVEAQVEFSSIWLQATTYGLSMEARTLTYSVYMKREPGPAAPAILRTEDGRIIDSGSLGMDLSAVDSFMMAKAGEAPDGAPGSAPDAAVAAAVAAATTSAMPLGMLQPTSQSGSSSSSAPSAIPMEFGPVADLDME